MSTEAALRSAVATAEPGSTIAINGMIVVSGRAILIERSDLRLGCATPAAGLQGHPTYLPVSLLEIRAPRVSVTGLRLDAQSTSEGAVWVWSPSAGIGVAADVMLADNDITCGPVHCVYFEGTPRALIARNQMAPAVSFDTWYAVVGGASGVPGAPTAEDVTVTENDLTCGTGACVFFFETQRAVITGNRVTASSTNTGIHVQQQRVPPDGTRIERNTVTTSGPSTNPNFGGIRVTRGKGIVVNDNLITGPWANGISVIAQTDGEIARNEVRVASQYGIAIGVTSNWRQDGLSVRNNKVTDAGYAGIGVNVTCGSMFVGNNLNGNVRGAEFFPSTGANTLRGNGTIVFDNGARDCDGDGVIDPNVISGAKGVHKGPPLGPVGGDTVGGVGSALR
ncbi:MAG: right-handed parallel beta-helix repeat-containing protein [Gemmatimonadaceae bacterium]